MNLLLVALLDGFYLTLVQALLVLPVLLNQLIDAVLFHLGAPVEVFVKTIAQVFDRSLALLSQVLASLFVRVAFLCGLDFMLQAVLHVLDFVVGILCDLRDFNSLLLFNLA